MMISVRDIVENVGKRKYAGYQHFFVFPPDFQEPSLTELKQVFFPYHNRLQSGTRI